MSVRQPHDLSGSLDSCETTCKWCEATIYYAPGQRAPRYCGPECFYRAKALRESDRRKDLLAHGLCPRCKHPL